jgi:RNA polymerase sigma factor (sigma-70 family)
MPKKKKSEFLTKSEEAALVRLAQAGDVAARNRLVESNWRFIWSETIKFVGRYGIYAADELVGHAAEAYMRAIEGFDLAKGFRLNTYAGQSIWRALTNAVADTRSTVHVPRSTQRTHSKGNCNADLTKQIECALHPTISLSANNREDRECQYIPFVMPPADEECEPEESRRLRESLGSLNPKQRTVIESLLAGMREVEIAATLGVTSQRIWQIKADAICILRRTMLRPIAELAA